MKGFVADAPAVDLTEIIIRTGTVIVKNRIIFLLRLQSLHFPDG